MTQTTTNANENDVAYMKRQEELYNQYESLRLVALELGQKKNEIENGIMSKQEMIETFDSKMSAFDSEAEKLIMAILGQMYNGVLINDKVSVRNGSVYPYKCRYRMSLNQLVRYIETSNAEIIQKLGEVKLVLLNNVIKLGVELKDVEYKIQETIVMFKKPHYELEAESDYGYRQHQLKGNKVEGIRINSNGVSPIRQETDGNGNIIRNIVVDFTNINRVININKDDVEVELNKVYDKMKALVEKQEKLIEEIKVLGGDYLILANLKQSTDANDRGGY